jgi:adenylate kinase family enzyme
MTDGLLGKGTQCERLVKDYGFAHLSGMFGLLAYTEDTSIDSAQQLATCSEQRDSVKARSTER